MMSEGAESPPPLDLGGTGPLMMTVEHFRDIVDRALAQTIKGHRNGTLAKAIAWDVRAAIWKETEQ